MIKYKISIKNDRAKTVEINSGEVSDKGEIAFDIPKDAIGGFIKIEWALWVSR